MESTDIQLSPDALRMALHLRETTPEFQHKSLRVYIDGKGCDGFEYGVTFDEPTAEDYVSQQGELELIVDKDTHQFVVGSSLEWVDDERGKGFVVENPNHKKFRGKFFKRKSWQQRLLKTHEGPPPEVNSPV